MRDRILNGEHDLVGVLLFGTVKHKVPEGQQGFPHVYVVQALEEPSASSMRELSLLCQAEDAAAGASDPAAAAAAAAADDFGHMDVDDPEPLDLANVLWVTSMMFNSTASKNTRRRLCERFPPQPRVTCVIGAYAALAVYRPCPSLQLSPDARGDGIALPAQT